jgi:alpha-1,2-mannosyltransferase
MFANTLAFSYALQTPASENKNRTLYTTIFFALGAIVGWPFSLALSIPFVLEELFVHGSDRVLPDKWKAWFLSRVVRLYTAVACASLLFVSLGISIRISDIVTEVCKT